MFVRLCNLREFVFIPPRLSCINTCRASEVISVSNFHIIRTETETMSLMSYYDILGCTKDSTPEDIKRAYRSLALKYHPDKNTSEFDGVEFQRILEAWNVLRDPKSKEEYDTVQKQEELDSESIPIYARVSVDELEEIADNGDTLTYRCRCGGSYLIERESVQRKNQAVCVPCLECTFLIVVET